MRAMLKSSARHISSSTFKPRGRNSRVADVANIDRYTIIRRFFVLQARQDARASLQLSRSFSTVRSSGRTETSPLHLTHSFNPWPYRPSVYCSSAHFRAYSDLRKNDEQSGSRHDQGPSSSSHDKEANVETGQKNPQAKTDQPYAAGPYHLNLEDYSRFFRRLVVSLPPLHRPTKEDFLNITTTFWERLRVRFKWFTIRSFRKFNADEMSAFFTWFLMSQTLWILVGTTTFFSFLFATANSLRLQEHVARLISDYLTSETGITIIFESAIVPKWKNSTISFKNVYVSRRPADSPPPPPMNPDAGQRAISHYQPGEHSVSYSDGEDEISPMLPPDPNTNYAMFDLNVDSIDVTLSLWRWLDGKGLVDSAVVKGVRGVMDRRHITWDPENPLDPAAYRHPSQPGDFHLESLQLEDILITVYQPDYFRPYTASIFRADIRTFRKQWMFYDFLRAENVVGQFDNCLFSLHKPQSIGRTMEQDMKDGQWSRMARFRIDGVNIDHIQAMTSREGPISWIMSGKLDAVLDIRFPRETDEPDLNDLLGELADAITTVASKQASRLSERIPGQRELAKPALSVPDDPEDTVVNAPSVVSIDIDLRFRDLKAAVPLFTPDLSYINNALIRPIVAFMNANRTLVPIHCKAVKDINDFDGAWTMWETGLIDVIGIKTYDALAYHVTQANFNRRVRQVSIWSLQKTAEATISTLKSVMDPMSTYLRQSQLFDAM